MARPKCDFLSGADITTNIVKALVAKVLELGGNADDVYALITKDGAHKVEPIARILVEKPVQAEPPPPAYRLGKSFAFEANYEDAANWQEFEVGKDNCAYLESGMGISNFPNWKNKKGKHQVAGQYVEFSHDPSNDEILAAFEALGLERPDIVEHRSFHKASPKERLEVVVVSLCGGLNGGHVACVYADGRGFDVYFYHRQVRWSRHYRFFGVRKPG